jgi:hypothetical protein
MLCLNIFKDASSSNIVVEDYWSLFWMYDMAGLCGLVVRVSGYRSIGRGFDSWAYQIFWEVEGLEQGPLSLVRTIEELLE